METTFLDQGEHEETSVTFDPTPSPTMSGTPMEWSQLQGAQHQTFQLRQKGTRNYEPEVLYIVRSGFNNMYHVIREDGYDNVGGSYALLAKSVIERRYDIKII